MYVCMYVCICMLVRLRLLGEVAQGVRDVGRECRQLQGLSS